MILDKQIYIESAKFLQNILIENNINCYLIGGSLINSIRDDGVLDTEDIDFAVLSDGSFEMINLIDLFKKHLDFFTWTSYPNLLTVHILGDKNKKIDFFKFTKRHLNYYMFDMNWIHEKICSFQTFKKCEVVLEGKSFLTVYRPDIFLKTVYGDYSIKQNKYKNLKGGDTSHSQECVFYVDPEHFDKIDFQIENLKNFFKKIIVKFDLIGLDESKINIFDAKYADEFDKNKYLFYKDFTNFLVKNDVNFNDF